MDFWISGYIKFGISNKNYKICYLILTYLSNMNWIL